MSMTITDHAKALGEYFRNNRTSKRVEHTIYPINELGLSDSQVAILHAAGIEDPKSPKIAEQLTVREVVSFLSAYLQSDKFCPGFDDSNGIRSRCINEETAILRYLRFVKKSANGYEFKSHELGPTLASVAQADLGEANRISKLTRIIILNCK